jgi:hypothetical protein
MPMNLKRQLLACAAAGLAALAPAAYAGDLYVISNPGTTVNAADVRGIYLGERQFAGSVKLVPVDNSAAQEQFLAKVLSMDASKYNASWTKKSFRDGVNPPTVKGGDAETIEYVKTTAGALGYVGSAPTGVNVVGKF